MMEEHIVKLEKRSGSSITTHRNYIVPKRVYDAIDVLLNPTKEGLSVTSEEHDGNYEKAKRMVV